MAVKNKTCVKCEQNLSITKFYKAKNQSDGYDYYCKECRKTSSLRSHRGGKHKPLCTLEGCETPNYAGGLCKMHYERKRRTGTPELKNFGRDSYYGQPYNKVRANHLRLRYQITLEEYEEMAKNGCEICGRRSLRHKKLHVDHDHKCCPVPRYADGSSKYHKTCGKCIRGVLCDRCNGTVGLYEAGKLREEYPDRNKIIIYVAKYDQLISDRISNYEENKSQEGR
jgi:hypothetical protein